MIYLPSLRYWDPNSRPLDHLSHAITARLYIKRTLYLKKYVRQKWVYCKHLVFLFFSFQCLRSFWSSGVCLGASKTSKNLRLYYCISTLKRASFARSYLQANASGSELKHVFCLCCASIWNAKMHRLAGQIYPIARPFVSTKKNPDICVLLNVSY